MTKTNIKNQTKDKAQKISFRYNYIKINKIQLKIHLKNQRNFKRTNPKENKNKENKL